MFANRTCTINLQKSSSTYLNNYYHIVKTIYMIIIWTNKTICINNKIKKPWYGNRSRILTNPCNNSSTLNDCNGAIQQCLSSPCKFHIHLLPLTSFQLIFPCRNHYPFFYIWLYISLSVSYHPTQWFLFEVVAEKEISELFIRIEQVVRSNIV